MWIKILKAVNRKDTSRKGMIQKDTIGVQTFTHSVICEPLIICGNALARMVIPTLPLLFSIDTQRSSTAAQQKRTIIINRDDQSTTTPWSSELRHFNPPYFRRTTTPSMLGVAVQNLLRIVAW